MSHIQSIHYINYLVKDLEKSVPYFTNLFNTRPIVETISGREVKTARFVIGDAWFVLVQPLSDIGEVASILAQRDEGLFLLSFTVDSLNRKQSRNKIETPIIKIVYFQT